MGYFSLGHSAGIALSAVPCSREPACTPRCAPTYGMGCAEHRARAALSHSRITPAARLHIPRLSVPSQNARQRRAGIRSLFRIAMLCCIIYGVRFALLRAHMVCATHMMLYHISHAVLVSMLGCLELLNIVMVIGRSWALTDLRRDGAIIYNQNSHHRCE